MTVDELNDRSEKQQRLLELIETWRKEDMEEERLKLEIHYFLSDFYEACTNGKLLDEERATELGLEDWVDTLFYRLFEVNNEHNSRKVL